MQKFSSLIISRFQSINPEKKEQIVGGPSDLKSEMRIITLEDEHFDMWREFVERHHKEELINPDTLAMYKEKAPFIASTKFHLNREFFKHFGYFTNEDFKSYVQHLLGRTPGRTLPYPKVTVHKTIHIHASRHTGHEWVERRKRKKVVLEELEGLQDDLSFFKGDGSMDGYKWRYWKEEHRVSSAT